jgi:N6-adenosine-specific RNA methylase IME4
VSGTYRAIVADPPWRYDEGWPVYRSSGEANRVRVPLEYPTMSAEQICALPVRDLADGDGCHLYLWTTNRYLQSAFAVVKAWGFRYSQTLVWAKSRRGLGPGGAFVQNVEYVIFARLGRLPTMVRIDSCWFDWPRPSQHSRKPEHFIDLVEQVSPGPYLELFSRRHRLGWDVWGDQVESSLVWPGEGRAPTTAG